jgi:hypothetical protein
MGKENETKADDPIDKKEEEVEAYKDFLLDGRDITKDTLASVPTMPFKKTSPK